MMKIEEAIKLLHPDTSADEIAKIKYKYGFRGEEQARHKIEKACKIACRVMGKQIPKKPVYENKFDDCVVYSCPACKDEKLILDGDNYCTVCGQALDWSDEE